MSYKVLIVDDEKWIHELLKHIVDWQSFGFEIAGYATNGPDALDFICEHNPDLVVSDIRIPEIDGIELVKLVRSKGIDVHFVLISGYQEFQYAQDALRYRVDDYLLKPIEEEEVAAILRKIAGELRNQENSKHEIQRMAVRLDDSIKQLRVKTFENLLYSESSVELDLSELNKNCEMFLITGHFQVLLLAVDIDSPPNDSKFDLFFSKIEKEIITSSHSGVNESVTLHMNDFMVIVINYAEAVHATAYSKSVFEMASRSVNAYNRTTVTLSAGIPVSDLGSISRSLSSAKSQMYSRAVYGGNRIIEGDRANHLFVPIDELLTPSLKACLANAFELLDSENCGQTLERIFQLIHNAFNVDPVIVFSLMKRVLEILASSIERLEDARNGSVLSSFSLEEEFLRCTTLTNLIKRFRTYILNVLSSLSEEQRLKSSKPIERAKSYIKNHFNKQLTLTEIAQYVFLSEQYLSELFSKGTGSTITDFIKDYRIQMAKVFMADSSFRICDIAEKVGYQDARHFSKVFKTLVGVTPKEYRQMGIQ